MKGKIIAIVIGIAVAAIIGIAIAVSMQPDYGSTSILESESGEGRHIELRLEEKMGIVDRP